MAPAKETLYEARWFDNSIKGKERLVKKGHQTLESAKSEAVSASDKYGYAEAAIFERTMIGETENDVVKERFAFMSGKPVDIKADIEAAKQQAIKEAAKKLQAKPEIQPEKEKENTMANTETSATASKKVAAAKKTAKKAPVPEKGKKGAAKAPAKVKKPAAEPVGTPGSLLASFGLRAGTARAGLVTCLVENKGKMVPAKELLKATYGSQDIENWGKIGMVIKGAIEMIKLNSIAWHIERGKDDKGDPTVGLKAGKE